MALPLTSSAPAKPAKTFVSHAKLIGVITFVSRLLGMARESIAANYFGGGMVYSAFQFAFTVPNLFRKLLGEGRGESGVAVSRIHTGSLWRLTLLYRAGKSPGIG